MQPNTAIRLSELPTSVAVTITPTLAAQWLSRYTLDARENRTVRDKQVSRYARDMAAGLWRLNGETIILGSNGKVLDGQHRLRACVVSNTPFISMVCENVDPAYFATINSGIVRRDADVFYVKGYKNARNHAATVVWLWRYPDRMLDQATPSREESAAIDEAYPELPHWIEAAMRAKSVISPSILAFVACYGARIFGNETSEAFVQDLIEGIGLNRNSSVRILREKLLGIKTTRDGTYGRSALMAFTIKAYNAYANNQPMQLLKWIKDEPMPQFSARRVS